MSMPILFFKGSSTSDVCGRCLYDYFFALFNKLVANIIRLVSCRDLSYNNLSGPIPKISARTFK